MDTTNAARFRGQMLTKSANKFNPVIIWNLIQDYHQYSSESNLFNAQRDLDELRQPYNVYLDKYIESFIAARNALIRHGGNFEDGQLGRKLLHSVHPEYMNDVKIILRTLKPLTYDSVVSALRDIYQDNASLKASSTSYAKLNPVQDPEGNSSNFQQFWPKCTPVTCYSPHPSSSCFSKPGNEALYKKWKEALIKAQQLP
jgi:hypothetical protein